MREELTNDIRFNYRDVDKHSETLIAVRIIE